MSNQDSTTMSRLGFVSAKCLSFARQPSLNFVKRCFLSEAYQCREAWEKRLESPILKNVNLQNFYQEMDHNFMDNGIISAIDADIFINANTEKGFLEDVEDILLKLRRGSDSSNTPAASHHAVVRLFLDAGKTNQLMKIITDKMKYGIFPDHFCLNLMMNQFLKERKFTSAARVAVLLMLQEDCENLLTTRLALYSCHLYLKNQDQNWYLDGENPIPEPEPKEVVKVRVRYLRKPFFDDHFDLKDPNLLVGKTLCMFSSKVGGSAQLAASYNLLGLILYQKWDKVMDLVDSLLESQKPIYGQVLQENQVGVFSFMIVCILLAQSCLSFYLCSEALQLAKMSLETKPHVDSPAAEESKSSKPVKPDPVKEAAIKAELEMKQKVLEKVCALDAFVLKDREMLDELSLLVKESVKQQELREIEEQKKVWHQ